MKSPARRRQPGVSTVMLAHFTRAHGTRGAFDNLETILREARIGASKRMVRGDCAVVCLHEAALGALSLPLSYDARRRYAPFGIAVDKRYAYQMGARPVIYMPLEEAKALLPAKELWRVVRLELGGSKSVDWSFEREWRLVGDLPLVRERIVALVETWSDVDALYHRFAGDPPCAGVIPLINRARGSL